MAPLPAREHTGSLKYNRSMKFQFESASRLFRKQYFLPSEHGSWIWMLGPFIIGTAASGEPSIASRLLLLMALSLFLIRQPVMVLVKVRTRRRHQRDTAPALFWAIIYSVLIGLTTTSLILRGFHQLLLLAIPAVPVFTWYLYLISKRKERGQRGVELVGSGVLALAAPAAYWVSGGNDIILAGILWALSWLQSTASIINVYLRLEQRQLKTLPPLSARLRMGRRTAAYHIFNLALVCFLASQTLIPLLIIAAFGLMLIDALEGTLRPVIGIRPSIIGLRQLVSSSIFVVLASYAFRFTT